MYNKVALTTGLVVGGILNNDSNTDVCVSFLEFRLGEERKRGCWQTACGILVV
jgi:hypothetical protein